MQSLAFPQMPFIAPCLSLRLHSFLPPLPHPPPARGTLRAAISAPRSPRPPLWAPPRWRAGGPSAYSNDQSLRGQGRSERAKEQSVRGAALTVSAKAQLETFRSPGQTSLDTESTTE